MHEIQAYDSVLVMVTA